MNECPSHFALDDREIHGRSAVPARPHPAGCGRCAARLAERARDRSTFDAQAPALWTRIAAARQERRQAAARWRLARVGWPALLLGLGAVAFWAAPRRSDRHPQAYLAPKGEAPIEIVCRRDGQAFLLPPGGEVAPGDELRFRPLPLWPEGRFIQIGSVDGTGRYSPFYPAAAGAPSVALPAGAEPLDGSIRLDDEPGPERLLVVISQTPLSETAVAQSAEARAADAAPVDRIGDTPVHSAWFVLPKRAARAPAP